MRPHNAHVREYYRHNVHVREYYSHIYPMKIALRLIPPVLIFGFSMGILVANTWLAFQCAWPF